MDLLLAVPAAALLLPIFVLIAVVIYVLDRESPFYIGERVGMAGRRFGMIKFRSMVVDAETSGVMSTAGDDQRITPVGRTVRKLKLDEIPQLLNILKGDMSFVGPRPNVPSEVDLYSDEEGRLLTVRPGVTDIASIVFADESDILAGSQDPDLDYNLLIRPWKSRLALHYLDVRSISVDLAIILLTAIGVLSRGAALKGVVTLLKWTGADEDLVAVASREGNLRPCPPPGVTKEAWQDYLRTAN